MNSRLGLEKRLALLKGAGSPEGSKGRKLGSSGVGCAVLGPHSHLGRRAAALVGLGTAHLAPCLSGQCF